MNTLLIKKFTDAIINEINEGIHISFELLKEMKSSGFSSVEAYNLFESIRVLDFVQADEEKEELVMSAMDIIGGFCAKHRLIWDPPAGWYFRNPNTSSE